MLKYTITKHKNTFFSKTRFLIKNCVEHLVVFSNVPICTMVSNNVSHSLPPMSIGQLGCSSPPPSHPQAYVQLRFVLKQLRRAALHLTLHPQVTSSRHASGIGGSLVHIAIKQSDYSIIHAEMSVGEGMSICSWSACSQIFA